MPRYAIYLKGFFYLLLFLAAFQLLVSFNGIREWMKQQENIFFLLVLAVQLGGVLAQPFWVSFKLLLKQSRAWVYAASVTAIAILLWYLSVDAAVYSAVFDIADWSFCGDKKLFNGELCYLRFYMILLPAYYYLLCIILWEMSYWLRIVPRQTSVNQ